MARPYPFHTLDVFTATRFAGNPLAVVLNADDMPGETMQRVAAEFGLSETIFVMAPEEEGHEAHGLSARVRIFTPVHEMPFAGHPTIGCAVHLAERHWPKGAFDEVLTLGEEVGPVPVRVRRAKGDKRVHATFTAPVVPRPMAGRFERGAVAAALGLAPDDVRADHPVMAHEGGPGFLYVPLASLDALSRARVVEPDWSATMRRDPLRPGAHERDSTYLYAPDPDGEGMAFRARMLAPGGGVAEDPGTGSASAILASQLLAAGALADGTTAIRLTQGVEMGRPCEIGVEVDVADGALVAVRVSGTAVRVTDGQIMA